MKTLFFSKYILLRNLATLSLLGILAGYLLPIPIIVWRVLFVIICGVALFERQNRLFEIEKFMFLLVAVCFAYFLMSYIGFGKPSTTLIGAILFTMPACNLFHLLHEKGVITQRWINVSVVLFLAAAAYFYRYNYLRKLGLLLQSTQSGIAMDIDMTNNASTVFLGLILFIMLSKNRVIQWSGMLVCWFYLLSSAKRGNIVGASLPTIFFLFPYFKESRRSISKFILFIIGISVAIWLGIQWFEQNAYLQSKIELAAGGDSSGRDFIYLYYLNGWSQNSSVFNLLFGKGFSGTMLSSIEMKAHNDWIETLYDYGLFGLFFELMIFVSFLRLLRWKTNGRVLMASIVFIWLEKSMLSMGYMDPLNSFMYVALGIVLGQFYTTKQSNLLEYKKQ